MGTAALIALLVISTSCSLNSASADGRPGVQQTVAPIGDDDNDTWPTYNSPNGKYAVDFPIRPTKEQLDGPAEVGPIDAAVAEVDGTVYLAGHIEIPDGVETSLDAAVQGAFDGAFEDSTIDNSVELTLGSAQCRQARGSGFAQGYDFELEALICENGAVLYQLLVTNPVDALPEIDRFFDSFTIND